MVLLVPSTNPKEIQSSSFLVAVSASILSPRHNDASDGVLDQFIITIFISKIEGKAHYHA